MAKHIEKHFGGINIGDLDKIVSYMRLNCCSGLILMCACFPSGVVTSVVDMEAEALRETCAYVVESCIRGHHVSKDFWTPLINEVLVCARSLVEAGTVTENSTLMARELLVYRFFSNIAVTPFSNST